MLLDAFIQQCQLRPQAIALSEGERQLSYQALLAKSLAISAQLQGRGIACGDTVAIFIDRSIDATVAIFGVLLAGACYVPLDVKNPSNRLAFIVADADVKAVVGLQGCPTWLQERLWLVPDEHYAGLANPVAVADDALAAILYTSGSTGHPRGVALDHAAISAFTCWASNVLALTADDRIANSAPFFFDLSTFDLYAVLGAGASLHFMPSMLSMAPARLSAWLQATKITGWYAVPSLLKFLAYKGHLQQTDLSMLRFLLFAGEVFPIQPLTDLANVLPHVALYNFFGPTETNVCCYWRVQREVLSQYASIPIGIPAAGCELHIDGASGELWVRGPTLASGYYREGRLTSFLNQQGWYATGDQVSYQNGEYHFHGRLGRMLKCSGYRVEPAEIERVVAAITGVLECAVIGLDDPVAGQRPGLALVLAPETMVGDVRRHLIQHLPSYMQPSRYQVQEALPRLSNGKLDYQSLKAAFDVAMDKY